MSPKVWVGGSPTTPNPCYWSFNCLRAENVVQVETPSNASHLKIH